ncbi:PQQ-dependent sugar dehydrogenase [bacterium]|nr:PQQ-dependent sugar dehydrogenase [bacterium]
MNKVLLLFSILLTICSGQVHAQPYGLTERVPNTDFQVTTSGGPLSPMLLEQVFKNFTFENTIFLTNAGDGTNRIFVVEKRGRIWVFENDPEVTEKILFLNITGPVNSEPNEAGLLGLAFHPDYANNGKFYVYYTYWDLYSRIAEYTVSSDPNVADGLSEREILSIRQPFWNHNGGMIAFGPDGYLYISFGDGGSGGDPLGSGQSRATLLGKILRIDVNQAQPGMPYAVPPDNPFYGNTQNWRQEIWAFGFRNVWRFSFDRETGDLWAGDVGQNKYEEIDFVVKGGNYGWNTMEGKHCYNPPSGCSATGLILPVEEYEHNIGRSVTGGYVYRGTRLLGLYGTYLYGDYVTRWIWGIRYENGVKLENTLIGQCPSSITSFGEDESGDVYVVGQDGRIYRFQEQETQPSPGTVPLTISGSGLYRDMETLTPAEGLLQYEVNSPLWSDGASKTRFIALPGTEQIGFSADSAWTFPENGVLVKNFFLDLEEGHPETRRIVETRFLIRHNYDAAWDGFSYAWRDDGSDADLLDSSLVKSFLIQKKDGRMEEQLWYYPSRSDCQTCHTPAAGWALSTRTAQLNRDYTYPSAVDNQLRSLNHIALFTEDIGDDPALYPRLVNPADTTADLTLRVRSYLDANCSNCHRQGGTGRTNMNLRYDIETDDMHILDIPAELSDLGVPGAKRVASGAPDSSVLFLRMMDTGEFRMPQLATFLVDSQAVSLVEKWILSMGDTATSGDTTQTDTTQTDTTSTDTTSTDTTETAIRNMLKQPRRFALDAPRPNPFNAVTTIEYAVPVPASVTVRIFDIRGRLVDRIHRPMVLPGYERITWPADHRTGTGSGVYVAEFSAASLDPQYPERFHTTCKLLLLK